MPSIIKFVLKATLVSSLLALQTACSNIAPIETGKPVAPDSKGASRLWHAASEFESGLSRMGLIYANEEMSAYVKSVYDRLYPEFADSTRVHILRDSSLNAFALPNGGIYVNSGLVATLENEAQLASVLSHEGIHFLNKHSERQRQTNSVLAGVGFSVAMLGVPFAELFVYGSMSGYSRGLEREADTQGLQHYLRSGYAPAEAHKAFAALEREAKLQEKDNKVPYFFSSHPKLKERISSYQKMTRELDAEGKVGEQAYAQQVRNLWLPVLEDKLTAGSYDSLIALLEQERYAETFGAQNAFYAAEALRMRNGEGDRDRSREYYLQSISRDPNFPPPYRALGVMEYKTGDYVGAAEHFQQYLALAPQEDETPFIQQYLQIIQNKVNK